MANGHEVGLISNIKRASEEGSRAVPGTESVARLCQALLRMFSYISLYFYLIFVRLLEAGTDTHYTEDTKGQLVTAWLQSPAS